MADKQHVEWTKALCMRLIKLYKERECLWNPNISDYKRKDARDAARDEILQDLHNEIPHLTAEDLKKKIHCMRSQFSRELRNSAAAGNANVSGARLWFFQEMEFLTDVHLVRDISFQQRQIGFSGSKLRDILSEQTQCIDVDQVRFFFFFEAILLKTVHIIYS